MIQAISSKWWIFLLRGLAGIAVGAIAFVQPGAELVALVLVLGFYSFLAGALALAVSATGVAGDRWWALLLEGIIGIVVAILVWSWPVASALAFVYFVAAWLIMTGIVQVAAGIRFRDLIDNEWLYIVTGVVSVVFGVFVFRMPSQGAVATAFLFGWYFLLFGLIQLVFAFRLKSLQVAIAK